MRALIAFTKKEAMESIRTYKLLIVVIVFLIFGMLNPLVAKIMPELLSSFMPEGITITLAEPTRLDSWMQFYKNIATQLILVIIVFSGIVANEFTSGTLINVLTKGLSRKIIILSKFIITTFIWTISYLICMLTTYTYTQYLLSGELTNLLFSALCMWLFGVMMISIMLLGGVVFGNIYGSLIGTGMFAIVLMILNIFPNAQKYNPYLLASQNVSLLTTDMVTSEFMASIVVACILIVGSIVGTILIFNKKQL